MVARKAMVIRIPKAVMPLIGINVFMFFLQIMSGPAFTQSLVLDSSAVLFKPWTLITSMFLHGDFSHILFNMYALMMFGPLIEQRIGSTRFLQLYFGSGILAGLGYAFFQEIIFGVSASALGASGAIMGVLGMTIILLPDMKVLFFFMIPMSMRTAGIVFAAIDVIGVFTPNNVANVAHLFGLAAGLIYGRTLVKQKKSFYKKFARPYPTHEKKQKKDYNKTIELNEDDVKEYLKKGRL